MNPINFTHKISDIPQIHYIGKEDKVVPKSVAENFVSNYKKVAKNAPELLIVSINATHQKGWEAQWSTLILTTPSPLPH